MAGSTDSLVALMDTSIVYGAARVLMRDISGTREDSRGYPDRVVDKNLFREFMHCLILYDNILVNDSSTETFGVDVQTLLFRISGAPDLVETDRLSEDIEPEPVIEAVCRIVCQLPDRKGALAVPIPWYYRAHRHYDYKRFAKHARRYHMPEHLLPFALFAYRGIFYAGVARGPGQNRGVSVYVASPGRVSALNCILSNKEMKHYRFPKQAYYDLLLHLELPQMGYDFGVFTETFWVHEVSPLTMYLDSLSPQDALDEVIALRKTAKIKNIRKDWCARLRELPSSSFVGANINQNIENAYIEGDVNMYVRAAAC